MAVFVSYSDLEDTRRPVRHEFVLMVGNAHCPHSGFASPTQQIHDPIQSATTVLVVVSRRFLSEDESLGAAFRRFVLLRFLRALSIRQRVARSHRAIGLRSTRVSTPINTPPLYGAVRAIQADVRLRTLKLARFLQRHLPVIGVFRRGIERAACFQTLGMTPA